MDFLAWFCTQRLHPVVAMVLPSQLHGSASCPLRARRNHDIGNAVYMGCGDYLLQVQEKSSRPAAASDSAAARSTIVAPPHQHPKSGEGLQSWQQRSVRQVRQVSPRTLQEHPARVALPLYELRHQGRSPHRGWHLLLPQLQPLFRLFLFPLILNPAVADLLNKHRSPAGFSIYNDNNTTPTPIKTIAINFKITFFISSSSLKNRGAYSETITAIRKTNIA